MFPASSLKFKLNLLLGKGVYSIRSSGAAVYIGQTICLIKTRLVRLDLVTKWAVAEYHSEIYYQIPLDSISVVIHSRYYEQRKKNSRGNRDNNINCEVSYFIISDKSVTSDVTNLWRLIIDCSDQQWTNGLFEIRI